MNYLILKAGKHLNNSFTEGKKKNSVSSTSLGILELKIKSIMHGPQLHIQVTASQKSKESEEGTVTFWEASVRSSLFYTHCSKHWRAEPEGCVTGFKRSYCQVTCSLVLFTPVSEPLFELTLGSMAFLLGAADPWPLTLPQTLCLLKQTE